MGGFGSGGRRVGSGRKSKGARILNLHGGRDRKPKTTARAPLPPVDPPKGLTKAELVVWRVLAPLALQQNTLTTVEAGALADLCVAIVERNRMRATIDQDGWTFRKALLDDDGGVISVEIRKHPLIPEYKQWMIRVEAGRARFRLAPIGKELIAPAIEVDPFAEFEGEAQG